MRLVGTHPAGHALAAGLVPEEAQDVRAGREQVGAFGDDRKRARAEHRACLGKRLEVERYVEGVRAEEVRRRAARLEGQELRAVANAAGELDQLAGGGAHRNAVHVGPLDVAGHREELHAGGLAGPLLLPPLGAALDDDRHVGERLDGVHERRLAPEPVHARERRLVARLAAMALHALEQRGLLAEDVAAGRGEDLRRAAGGREPSTSVPSRPSDSSASSSSRSTASSARTRGG